MRKDKEKAIQLRKAGLSFKKIRDETGIPISTLSVWFKDQPWSMGIKNKLSAQASLGHPDKIGLMAQATRERWKLKHEEYRTAAVKEFNKLKDDPLFLAGIMLYWGEGDKISKNSIVRLTNNNPDMLKIFYLFLTRSIGITPDKTSASLLLYPDLIDAVQKNFWSKATGIPIERFNNSVYIKNYRPKKRVSYGVCHIIVNSRALKERILKWIELYQEYLK